MKRHRTARARWRPKQPKLGQMNQTEAAYELVLLAQQQAGEIAGYRFQPFKVRLGNDFKFTYTPDFMVFRRDGEIELVDVKGGAGWEEHTRIKIKSAAVQFPQFHWVGVQRKTKRGPFEREEF